MKKWCLNSLLRSPGISKGGSGRDILLLFLLIILLGSCTKVSPTSLPTLIPALTLTPNFHTPEETATLTGLPSALPTSSPTQPLHAIWIAPYLPDSLRAAITLDNGFVLASSPEGAEVRLDVGAQGESPDSQWIYALVAPFPTITDGVTSDDLHNLWFGNTSNPFNGQSLLLDESTLGVLSKFWGSPSPQAVQVLPSEDLLDYAWDNRPSWAIIPFEALEPRWKVLTIDDQSPTRKDFDASTYPLAIPFVLSGANDMQTEALNLPNSNRDPSHLTTLAMTGVTALVRGTALTMEQSGVTYPALDIGPLLASADITHISNEIPFAPNCPFPELYPSLLVFCSDPRYIELLQAVGTDIVELTGDHFSDYGPETTLYTLQMYQDLGWHYYGGGANAEEARKPLLIENNGNRLAFLGCNVGCTVKNEIPCDAIATDTQPGAAQCDFNWISTEIPSLREEGYQVIFTFQHREYYTYTTEPILAEDFGRVAVDGATIVSGSQAHQPHGFSFENGAYIHYGLGNLFFDQYHFCADYACDDAFIDRHVFYNGRYISTELITIRFIDLARPRLMTSDEQAHFLEIIFHASGW